MANTKKILGASTSLASTARARAYLGTAQDNVANTTWTKVNLQSETYDPGNNFDSATNKRFVAPVAGYYVVTAQVTWATTVAGKTYGAAIYKNNAATTTMLSLGGDTLGDYVSHPMHDILSLAANDYVELFCYQATGAATADLVADATYTYLAISFIGT